MATVDVTVEMPDFLERPELLTGVVERAAVTALDVEMPHQATEIIQSGDFPKDRGLMQRSLSAVKAVVRKGFVEAKLVFTGQASTYGIVQEKGRKAGSRNPPFAAIAGWVKRRRRDAVDELATQLQANYRAEHPKKRKGVSRAIGKFRRQAIFLIARGVVRRLREFGMKAKRFVQRRLPDMERDIAATLEREIGEELRRLGADG